MGRPFGRRYDIPGHVQDPKAHHVHAIATGRVYVYGISNDHWSDDWRAAIDVDFKVDAGITIPYCVNDHTAYGGTCFACDCRIQVDGSGDVVPYNPATGHGCWIQYIARNTPPEPHGYDLGIAYIVFNATMANTMGTEEDPGMY